MKTTLLLLLLSLPCAAHPLDWMQGSYHSRDTASQMDESWTLSDDGQLLGTTVWLEEGALLLTELFRIQPRGSSYQLDLWLHFASGASPKHIVMQGGPTGARECRFQGIQNGQPESLSYRKDEQGHLHVQLQKKGLQQFDLSPGPGPQQLPPVPQGSYRVFTYFSDQPMIDRLHWTLSPDADLGGRLEVPGKFTQSIEHVQLLPGRRITFEVLVPEGDTPYRVSYELTFSADMQQATGLIRESQTGRRLASLVLRKQP